MSKVYIVSAKRSAIGSFLGTLSQISPAEFGSQVLKQMFEENVNGIKNDKSIIYEGAGHSIIAEEPEKLANDINNFILK